MFQSSRKWWKMFAIFVWFFAPHPLGHWVGASKAPSSMKSGWGEFPGTNGLTGRSIWKWIIATNTIIFTPGLYSQNKFSRMSLAILVKKQFEISLMHGCRSVCVYVCDCVWVCVSVSVTLCLSLCVIGWVWHCEFVWVGECMNCYYFFVVTNHIWPVSA